MTKRKILGLSIIMSSVLSACTTGAPEQYYWGQYETLIKNMYVNAGKATPQIQIAKITEDIQKAENAGKPIPPGVYAHLGFMYSLDGNNSAATAAFNEETARYKESETLINGMLARAKKVTDQK